jgi:XTP/dITP diphosphohydrolase
VQLLLATTNKGKVTEIREALAGIPVETVSLYELETILDAPHEIGDTFAANAEQKARYYSELLKMPSLADDSGILVEALQNELGIHTRRWGAGPTASDAEWIEFFLNRMRHEKNKRARFVCSIALIGKDGRLHMFEGECDGVITDTLEAGYLSGLPISACFKPDGFDQVYSSMTVEQKNAVSHRGRALKKARDFLAGSVL